jgi:hypothetical protein
MNTAISESFSNISIPLTILVFFAKFGEKISKWDLLGSVIILVASFFNAIGAYKNDADKVGIAILLGALIAVSNTVNTLNIRFIIKKVKFPVD